jgi:hypothetical protein
MVTPSTFLEIEMSLRFFHKRFEDNSFQARFPIAEFECSSFDVEASDNVVAKLRHSINDEKRERSFLFQDICRQR